MKSVLRRTECGRQTWRPPEYMLIFLCLLLLLIFHFLFLTPKHNKAIVWQTNVIACRFLLLCYAQLLHTMCLYSCIWYSTSLCLAWDIRPVSSENSLSKHIYTYFLYITSRFWKKWIFTTDFHSARSIFFLLFSFSSRDFLFLLIRLEWNEERFQRKNSNYCKEWLSPHLILNNRIFLLCLLFFLIRIFVFIIFIFSSVPANNEAIFFKERISSGRFELLWNICSLSLYFYTFAPYFVFSFCYNTENASWNAEHRLSQNNILFAHSHTKTLTRTLSDIVKWHSHLMLHDIAITYTQHGPTERQTDGDRSSNSELMHEVKENIKNPQRNK